MKAAKPSMMQLIGIGIVNGLLIGGGLAMAHRDYWFPLAIAISTFIVLTYYLSCRRAA